MERLAETAAGSTGHASCPALTLGITGDSQCFVGETLKMLKTYTRLSSKKSENHVFERPAWPPPRPLTPLPWTPRLPSSSGGPQRHTLLPKVSSEQEPASHGPRRTGGWGHCRPSGDSALSLFPRNTSPAKRSQNTGTRGQLSSLLGRTSTSSSLTRKGTCL